MRKPSGSIGLENLGYMPSQGTWDTLLVMYGLNGLTLQTSPKLLNLLRRIFGRHGRGRDDVVVDLPVLDDFVTGYAAERSG